MPRQGEKVGCLLAARHQAAILQQVHQLVRDRVAHQPARVDPDARLLARGEAGRALRQADPNAEPVQLGKEEPHLPDALQYPRARRMSKEHARRGEIGASSNLALRILPEVELGPAEHSCRSPRPAPGFPAAGQRHGGRRVSAAILIVNHRPAIAE